LTEFLSEYGLFLAKSVTLLFVVLLIVSAIGSLAARQRRGGESGRIEARRLNEQVDEMRDALRREVLDSKGLGRLRKAEEKARKKAAKKKDDPRRRRVWVLRFDGDIQASSVSALRQEVTAILTLAEAGDEVVACVDEAGREVARGLVNYSVEETRRILGCSSDAIGRTLGYAGEPELVHRDNLVVV
jgi:serine protease SohB